MGWAFKDHEKSYTELGYEQCVKTYFEMLQEENNPMLSEEMPFWENEQTADANAKKILMDIMAEQIGEKKLSQIFEKLKNQAEVKEIKLA